MSLGSQIILTAVLLLSLVLIVSFVTSRTLYDDYSTAYDVWETITVVSAIALGAIGLACVLNCIWNFWVW